MISRLHFALLFFCASTYGQQPQSDSPVTTLKLDTRLVSVQAVVVDSRGEPVRGLGREDFVLKQDGREASIRYFSQDDSLPLTLALMVDTSSSQRMFLEDEIRASEKFFRVMLTQPQDRALLVQFDDDILQRQALTSQVKTLENSLNFLSMPHAPNPNAHGGTLLFDAVVASANRFLSAERGRRALILLTDGEDNGSRATLDQAIAAAQRADAVVYSVLYSMAESGFGPRRPAALKDIGLNALNALSNATGGHVFTVSPKMPLDLIFVQIADDMRLEYQIGYTPPESRPGAYHRIELKPKAGHQKIRARQGYYSPG